MRARASLDALNFVLAGAREGFGPFIAVYLQAQGFDPAATGIVMSLAGVGGLTCTTPIGAWVDRSHRKRELLMLAVAVIAVGALTIVAVKSIFLIGFAQLLIGIGDTALAPLLAAITLGIVGHAAFAERMSRNEAFNNAGNATRSALASALGYFFGLQYVAVTIVLSSVLSSLVARAIPPNAIDHVAARAGETDDQPTWRALLRMRGLLLLALVVLIYQAASSAMLPFLAEARTAAGSDPSLTTGVMCVVSRGFMVPAALLAPRVARRRGYSGVMTIVLAMVVARAGLAYFAHSWAVVILVEMIEGLSVGMALVAIPVPQRGGHGGHGPDQCRPRPGADGVRRRGDGKPAGRRVHRQPVRLRRLLHRLCARRRRRDDRLDRRTAPAAAREPVGTGAGGTRSRPSADAQPAGGGDMMHRSRLTP